MRHALASVRHLAATTLTLGISLLAGPTADAQSLDPVTGEVRPGAVAAPALSEAMLDPDAAASRVDLTLVGRLADGETRGIALAGNVLYRSNGGYLEAIDVTAPASPVVLGRFLAEQGVVQGVFVQGSLAYVPVARGTPYQTRGSLQIVNVSDPTQPVAVGQVSGRSFFDVVVSGTTAYAAGTGLRIFDVSNPAAPVARGVVSVSGGSVLSVALDGTTAYISAGTAGMRVVDVSNPAAPAIVGTNTLNLDSGAGQFATRIAYAAGRAYVSVNNLGLVVLDVTTPSAPVEIGRFPIASGQVRSVAVAGTVAYVGYDDGVVSLDVSNPSAITQLGQIGFGVSGSGQSIVLSGGTAYVGNRYSGVRVLNVSNPSALSQVKLIENGGFSFKVNVVGGIAYVADLLGQVRLVDVSTPAAPRELGRARGIPNANGVDVAGGIAYVVDRGVGAGLTRVDVSNPAAPLVLGTTTTGGSAYGLDIDGSTLYIANGYGAAGSGPGSLLSASIAPGGVTLLSEAQPGNQAFDVRVAGGRAYVATFGSGLSIFDVSNPAAMAPLSLNAVGNFSSSVEVDGTTAYLADSQFGTALALTVVDASTPTAPTVIGTADGISGGTSVDVGLGSGYAYAAVDFVGMYQYDVANPAAPALRTTIPSADRATGVDVEGRTVVMVDAGAGVWVFQTPATTAGEVAPSGVELAVSAFPNPTAGDAQVRAVLPEAAAVTVEVFSVLGRRVARVEAGTLAAGAHALTLDGRTWAPGVYVVRLTAGAQTATSRLTVAR